MVALVAVMTLSSLSPLFSSTSDSPCATCHGSEFYQFLEILEGNQSELLPASIDGPGTLNVSIVIWNHCNAFAENGQGIMHEASATLSSQSGCFRVLDPTFWIGDIRPGVFVNATWQIYAARAGQDRLVINAQAINPHCGAQYADAYSPAPSISVNYTPPNLPPAIALGALPAATLSGGSAFHVLWTSVDEFREECRVSLYYSTDDFASDNITVGRYLPDTGGYDWTIPLINSTTVRLKADINDSFGLTNSSLSGIFGIDSGTPGILSVSPADGSANVTDSALISIEFSRKVTAETAEQAFSITPYTGDLLWSWSPDGRTMTATHDPFETGTAYTCTVGPGVRDTTFPGNMDMTSFSWSFSLPIVILPTPSIALLSPAGGERYYQGDGITVNWTAAGGTGALHVNVSFSANATALPSEAVASGLPGIGGFSFPAPPVVSDACTVGVTAYDAYGREATFQSARQFSIAKPITLTARFDSASLYRENDTINISWNAAGGHGPLTVSVRFQGENGPIPIASGRPAGGSMGWTVPRMRTTAGFLVVNATDDWGTAVENASFGIVLTYRGLPPANQTTNHPPVASFRVEEKPVLARRGATFNASGSYDPDNDTLTYTWNFGDGSDPVNTGNSSVIHVFLSAGSYSVVLTVSDGMNSTSGLAQVFVANAPEASQGFQVVWPLMGGIAVMIIVVVCAVYFLRTRGKRKKE